MRAKVSVPEIELGAFHLLARGDHLARVVVRHDARSSVATRLLARGWTDGWENGKMGNMGKMGDARGSAGKPRGTGRDVQAVFDVKKMPPRAVVSSSSSSDDFHG